MGALGDVLEGEKEIGGIIYSLTSEGNVKARAECWPWSLIPGFRVCLAMHVNWCTCVQLSKAIMGQRIT
jgi:hypothetical protein